MHTPRNTLMVAAVLLLMVVPNVGTSGTVFAAGAAPAHIAGPSHLESLSGFVTRSNGTPIWGARVHVVGIESGVSRSTTTSPSGSFSVPAVSSQADRAEDRFSVTASAAGYLPKERVVRSSRGSVIQLRLPPNHGTLHGLVHAGQRRQASGWSVQLVSEATAAVTTTRTTSDGAFSLA